MPVFTKQLNRVDYADPTEALREMANHIRYIQEQLEYTLMNLDSSNITAINTDETRIESSSGEVSFSGNHMALTGGSGETFEVGVPNGATAFRFTLNGKNGAQIMYLTSDGQLVITNRATISIDGGEW